MSDINQQQSDFLDSIDGVPSPDEAARLLELGTQSDEIPTAPNEPENEPETVLAEQSDTSDGQTQAASADSATENHDQGLVDEMASLRQQLAQQQVLIASLQQGREEKPETAPTDTPQEQLAQAAIEKGIDPAIFGDFSEEALTKGIQHLISEQGKAFSAQNQVFEQRLAEMEAQFKPVQAQHEADAQAEFRRVVMDMHPDLDAIVQGDELDKWTEGQPAFMKNAIQQTLEHGSAQDIVDLLNRFKTETGKAAEPAPPAVDDAKAKAQSAVEKAAPPVPTSLSDIPGGNMGAGGNIQERIAQMNPAELSEFLQGKTPEEIQRIMDGRP